MKVVARASLFVILVWSMVMTVLRAVRLPNDFAEAHWLIDYRFGFIKRGLIGTITSTLAANKILPQTETTITVLSIITFVLFCSALVYLMWRIVLRSNWSVGSYLIAAVFATSPSVVMNAHLMGYFDHVFMLLAFVSAWLAFRDRFWAAAILSAIAVLIHESFVVVGLPLVLLAEYVRLQTTSDKPRYRRMLPTLILPSLAFLALVAAEALRPAPGYLSMVLEFRLQNFPFIQDDRASLVPMWLTTSLRSYLKSQSPLVFERLRDHSTLIVIPSAITLVVFSTWRGRRTLATAVVVIAVTIVPLLLHIIAWDVGRISAYSLLAAFGCVWVYSEMIPAGQEDATPSLARLASWLIAIVVIVFNIFVRESLMDYQLERFSNMTRIWLYAPLLAGIVLCILAEMRRPRTIVPDSALLQQ